MAINKNHEFEELDGIKCAIVEKNASEERVAFLKQLLEYNNYKVVVVSSPPPKAAVPAKPAVPAAEGEAEPVSETPVVTEPLPPSTFTIGVSDVMFNPINAIFGRALKAPGGHIVTLAYWEQKETVANDEIPYYERR
jgi:hypothetical protein